MSENGLSGYRYGVTPEWILDADISDRAVRLFGVLGRYVGNNDGAWPSRRTLANRIRCSLPSLDRAIKELVDLGALTVKQRKRSDGSYSSSMYYMWPHMGGEGSLTVDTTYPHQRGEVASEVIQHERTLIERTSKKETFVATKKKTRAKKEYSPQFEEIWAIYPRHDAKPEAFRAFNARLAEGVSFEDLLEATKAYAQSRSGQDPSYTMMPKTFFGPNERYLVFIPGWTRAFKMTDEQIAIASIYDDFDSSGKWTAISTGQVHNTHPSAHGMERPVNGEGFAVDQNGRAYTIDNLGKRRYNG